MSLKIRLPHTSMYLGPGCCFIEIFQLEDSSGQMAMDTLKQTFSTIIIVHFMNKILNHHQL